MLPCNAGPLCQNIHVHNWWFFIGILLIHIVFSIIEFICCIVFPLCHSRPGLYFKILNSKLTSFTSNFFPDGKMTSNGFLCKLIWPCASITQWNINVSITIDLTTQGENLSSPPQNPQKVRTSTPPLWSQCVYSEMRNGDGRIPRSLGAGGPGLHNGEQGTPLYAGELVQSPAAPKVTLWSPHLHPIVIPPTLLPSLL